MANNLRFTIFISLISIFGIGLSARAALIPCTVTSQCPSQEICNKSKICGPLIGSLISTAVTDNGIYAQPDNNTINGTTTNLYSCFGTEAYCSTKSFGAPEWDPTKLDFSKNPLLGFNGLRSGRSYFVTFGWAVNGATDTAQSSLLTTWPGFGITPSDSDAGCDGITRLCKRNIAWTTPFAGDSTVVVNPNPPSWNLDSTTPPSLPAINVMDVAANGVVYGVGKSGLVLRRDTAGSWSTQNPGTTAELYSVGLFSDQKIWVGGVGGVLKQSTNGGASWSSITNTNLSAGKVVWKILPLTFSTALVLTTEFDASGPQVLYFDGSTWKVLYSNPGITCTSLAATTVAQISLACSSGTILHTNDSLAFAPQWVATIPTDANLRLGTIATVDGVNVWAGGAMATGGPLLYKSSDGGNTWAKISGLPAAIGTVANIFLISPNQMYFGHDDSVWEYQPSATPQFTQFGDPTTALGSLFTFALPATNSEIMVSGYNGQLATYALPIGSTKTTLIPTTTGHTVQVTGLNPNTVYNYYAQSTGSGVTITSPLATFTTPNIDTIPPTVTISPLAPFIKSCSAGIVVTGTAADTAPGSVVSVRVAVDGNAPITATGTTSWTATLPCAQITQGSHTVTAISNDGTNDSLPATTSFVFDNTAPTVTITAPTPVTTPTVTASGSASDVIDQVAAIQVQVNGAGPRINVPITVGDPVSWSLSNIALTTGPNTIAVFAIDRAGNEGSASTSVTYNVPTFSLAPEVPPPSTQTVAAGTTAVFGVRVTSVDGFTGTVSLTASSSPAGLSPIFTKQQVSLASLPYDISTMLVSSAAGNGSGPYDITITGTFNAITKTTHVFLTLTDTPDFTLSATPVPPAPTVVAGNPALYDLHVSGSSTYVLPGGGISWTTSALPSGVTVTSFGSMSGSPNSGGSATVRLTLNTTVTVPATTITITADDGTVSHQVTITLTATPPPDFSLTATPATASTLAGSSNPAGYNVTVKSLNGFGGSVHLSFGSVPADSAIHTTFSQNDFVPSSAGDVVTVNITADSSIQCAPVPPPPAVPTPCNYSLTFTGISGIPPSQKIKTAAVTLAVTPDTTPPVISGITASPSDTNVTISWVTDEPANSRFDLYADAAHGTIIGTIVDTTAQYCLTACHTMSYSNVLTPLTTYYYSVTSADAAYPTGNSTTVSADVNGPLKFTTQASPDNIFPTIVIDSPAASASVIGQVTLAGHADDNNPMSQVKVTVTGPGGATNLPDVQITCTSGKSCPFSVPWNTLNGTSPNGSYTLTVVAISSAGPAFQSTATRSFTVDNDTTPPTIECLAGQTVCEPRATVTCPANSPTCTALIEWRTNEDSTSEVEYGLAVDCSQQVQRPDGTFVACAYTNAVRHDDINDPNGLPNFIDHAVTLSNLAPNMLYHYRVTSCNISNLCTN